MTRVSLAVIAAYQRVLGPLFRGLCRYEPSCSRYAQEAIGRFGARRGWWLAGRRLARCHPLGGHGWDPVPATYVSWRQRRREKRAGAVGHGGRA